MSSTEDLLPSSTNVPEVVDEPEDLTLNRLQHGYTFWFRATEQDLRNPGTTRVSPVNYKDTIKKIASFQTVERFWQIYDHLKRPNEFKLMEFHMFREGIFPMWEDPENRAGGKWMIRLKKGISPRYWEDLLIALIGEQFDDCDVCGLVLSIRTNEDIISVWNKSADQSEVVHKIREHIRRIVRLPTMISIDYKRHQDSMNDRSSYRNPSIVSVRGGKPNGPGAKGDHKNWKSGGRWQDDEKGQSERRQRDPNTSWNRVQKSGGVTAGLPPTPAVATVAVEPTTKVPGETWTKVKNPFKKEH